MSVAIDTIGPTTLSRVTATTVGNINNTSYGITTSQVKNLLSNFVFSLDETGVISSFFTSSWLNVLTNLVATVNGTGFSIKSNQIEIGGASTTVKIVGNTLNVNATFPTILTGVSGTGRIQAGYVTVPAGTSLIRPPTSSAGGTLLLTGTQIGTVGINGNTASGFNIVSSVAQEVNWVFLY